eukprot:3969008-Prymnesium_polylepis.1
MAPIQRCKQSEVSVDRVLDIHGFDLERALQAVPGQLPSARLPCQCRLRGLAPREPHASTLGSRELHASALGS